ncbi:MAG: hypothetical protein R2911_00935 [Caldilineaceae bacterium]
MFLSNRPWEQIVTWVALILALLFVIMFGLFWLRSPARSLYPRRARRLSAARPRHRRNFNWLAKLINGNRYKILQQIRKTADFGVLAK